MVDVKEKKEKKEKKVGLVGLVRSGGVRHTCDTAAYALAWMLAMVAGALVC